MSNDALEIATLTPNSNTALHRGQRRAVHHPPGAAPRHLRPAAGGAYKGGSCSELETSGPPFRPGRRVNRAVTPAGLRREATPVTAFAPQRHDLRVLWGGQQSQPMD